MASTEFWKTIWDKYLTHHKINIGDNSTVQFKGEYANNLPVYVYTDSQGFKIEYYYTNKRWYGQQFNKDFLPIGGFNIRKSNNFLHSFLAPCCDPEFCLSIYNNKIIKLIENYNYKKFKNLDKKSKNWIVNFYICNNESKILPYVPSEIIEIILNYFLLIEFKN